MENTRISLSARDMVKHYGGVVALSDADLDVQSGQVLALIGANGSGKSTLCKIITGVVEPDGGQLTLDGEPVTFPSPQVAKNQGIAAVYQDLSLIPDMTVAENIWLTHEPLSGGVMVDTTQAEEETQALLDLFAGTYSAELEPGAPVSTLSPDERQIVEVLKALSLNPRLMILDEATASFDAQQVDRLFNLIADWKAAGKGIIFVSHRMEEIMRIADCVAVLRNGETVGTSPIEETDEEELVELMVGGSRAVPAQQEEALEPAEAPTRLEVTDLQTEVLKGIDLDVRDGELLGIGGLQGQGQADLLLAIFGVIPYSGRVMLAGEEIHFSHPRHAMQRGVALVPGDRASEGLLMRRSILENLQLPSWHRYGLPLQMEEARRDANRVADMLNLVMAGLSAPVSSLSGGNAQKVVLGKWLLRDPELLLLNDPTKGVDVGTKQEFYNLLNELRQEGTAIVLYSTDDQELLGLCDRVLVLQDGAVTAELAGSTLTHTELVRASLGSKQGNGV
jgi:ribose transport system ATP-binding protein